MSAKPYNERTNDEVYEALSAPFPFGDIEILAQQVSKNQSALAVAYLDARAVMNRLDDVVGFGNWWDKFEVVNSSTGKDSKAITGIMGTLYIRLPDGTIVERTDAAEFSTIESLKGGISNARKRCFAAMCNRWLYETDFGWQPCHTREWNGKAQFNGWTSAAIENMRRLYETQVIKKHRDNPRTVVVMSGDEHPEPKPEAKPKPETRPADPAPEPAPAPAPKPKPEPEPQSALRHAKLTESDIAKCKSLAAAAFKTREEWARFVKYVNDNYNQHGRTVEPLAYVREALNRWPEIKTNDKAYDLIWEWAQDAFYWE